MVSKTGCFYSNHEVRAWLRIHICFICATDRVDNIFSVVEDTSSFVGRSLLHDPLAENHAHCLFVLIFCIILACILVPFRLFLRIRAFYSPHESHVNRFVIYIRFLNVGIPSFKIEISEKCFELIPIWELIQTWFMVPGALPLSPPPELTQDQVFKADLTNTFWMNYIIHTVKNS